MSKHIVIDPITRIEGHLRIEAVIDNNNTIVDAYSSSTMFRGVEKILQGRDPRDCGLLAMRVCGVCTGTHYLRSIEAVENAFNINIPKNARLVRNLIQGSLTIHDHPVHFYNLAGLDWVDAISALKGDPKKAAREANKWAEVAGTGTWNTGELIYRNLQKRLTKFANQGRLGILANGYWGNKHYKLTPEQNLIALSHYFDVLDLQRDAAKMMAIFGGKNPHPQSIVVGGVTCVQDIENPSRIALFKSLLMKVRKFIKNAYLPDLYMAGTMYADEGLDGTGAGLKNYMSYGSFRLDDTGFYHSKLLFPSGVVLNGDLTTAYVLDQKKITEDVTHSWYKGDKPLHPSEGKTIPNYTGLEKKSDGIAYLKTKGKYSWIKSPIYDDNRVEVGPLARLIVGYANKDKRIVKYVNNFLKRSGLPAKVLFSSLGRTAARAIETEIVADAMVEWTNQLASNSASGDLSTWTKFDFDNASKDAIGYGLEEAPRGALGHWVKIKDGKVANYQMVVPTTWNAAPRDYKGRKGAYESALIGIKVANPDQPLEILRTIHSFDPCLACAVHIVDVNGKELGSYKVNAACVV